MPKKKRKKKRGHVQFRLANGEDSGADCCLTPDVVLSFDYDANSNRTEMAASIGGTADYVNSYVFDELRRLKSVTQQDSTGNTVASKHVTFSYNALGQTLIVNRFDDSSATNPALRTSFSYDGANRVASIDHKKVSSTGTATTLHRYDFDYDDASRLIEIDSTIDGVSSFEFDELNQLIGADHAGTRDDEAYTLDATGNRDDSNYDVEARNLTSSDGTYDYEYDKEGNRIKRTEISSDDYEEYEWDHRNRLVSIKSYDSGGGSSTQTITYSYDTFNRLTQRSFDADGDGSGTATDTFFAGFDGLAATLEFDNDSASDLSHRYLWGPDDQLLADEIVDSLTTEGEIMWALADQVGTIRDIGTWNDTSSEYEIANHRVYDSFGNLTDETNSSVDLAFGFTGRWTDPTTGLTHHLNRWFDSSIGKWLSNDPIGFGGGDANVQRYVVNNPLQFVDNNGLDKSPPGGGGGGGDDVMGMGVGGINQGADQGSVFGSPSPSADEIVIQLFDLGINDNTDGIDLSNPDDVQGGSSDIAGIGGDPNDKDVPRLDPTGHFPDPLPKVVPKHWSPDKIRDAIDEVESSLKRRHFNQEKYGREEPERPTPTDPTHPGQIKEELRWLRLLQNALYNFTPEPPTPEQVAGVATVGMGAYLMGIGAAGTGILVADDVTGFGVVDDVFVIGTGGLFVVGGVIWIFGG
jgi:RHS repeat-associated protein